ncbi:MAG: heme exporter protein CcmB [Dehalococcoidia bacterium]
MRDYLRPILALVWKDILLELRTRDIVVSVAVFALLVVLVFNFAFDPTPAQVAILAPGLLWAAFTFAGVLALSRIFILEKDRGSLEGLLLCPVSRDVIFFGKLLGAFLFMLLVEALLLPVFTLLFNFSTLLLGLLLTLVLATLGFAAVGTLFSAIAVHTRSREIMLPILFIPIVVPVLIAAVEASARVLNGAPWSEFSNWLQLLLVFDAIYLVICPWLFGFVLEE